jgi:hypothetical protein
VPGRGTSSFDVSTRTLNYKLALGCLDNKCRDAFNVEPSLDKKMEMFTLFSAL